MGEIEFVKTIYTKDAPAPGDYSQGKMINVGTGWLVYTAAIGPDFTVNEKESGDIEKLASEEEQKAGYVGPHDLAKQTTKALSNVRAVIEAGGGNLSDIVDMNVRISDKCSDWSGFIESYKAYFKEHGVDKDLPARDPVGVKFPDSWGDAYLILLKAVALIPNKGLEESMEKLDDIEGKP